MMGVKEEETKMLASVLFGIGSQSVLGVNQLIT